MRAIRKGKGPAFLAIYKKNHAGHWGALQAADKKVIREELVREQRGLCAYCMRRIHENPTPADATKIEHIIPQSHRATVFDWNNLVACCNGNQGRPVSEQTCDTRKGGRHLQRLNVLSPQDVQFGRTSGLISSEIPDVDSDLATILNLNEPALVAERKLTIDGLNEALKRRLKKEGSWEREPLQRFLHTKQAQAVAEPYLGLIEQIIGRLLVRMK